jgi:hypothetical protein
MSEKTKIIDSLYKVMCTSTSTTSDSKRKNNDYFKRRVLGFKAEIEFENLLGKYPKIKFLEGGQFISKRLPGDKDSKNSFIYTTVSFDQPELYSRIYTIISNWDEVTNLFFIKIEDSKWKESELVVKKTKKSKKELTKIVLPFYKFYKFNKLTKSFVLDDIQSFDSILNNFGISSKTPSVFNLRKKNQFKYFNQYDLQIIRKNYATRYFLDVILRKAQNRQIIDLDGFIETPKELIMVEIKEKTPITPKKSSKNTINWRYGWDSRRLLWYSYIEKKLNIRVLYNMRQVDTIKSRNFVQWDSVFLDRFLYGVGWSFSRSGGGGGDTLLAPYLFFERLENVLRELYD